MVTASVIETKNNLSGFLRMLESGQEDCVIVARHNKPVAKITLYQSPSPASRIGVARGEALYAQGWDSEEVNAQVGALFGVGL